MLIQTMMKSFLCQRPLTPKDYRISRALFLIEGSTGMAIYALSSGVFLAGFINYLGASDQFNGIVSSLPVLLGVAQLFAPLFLERLKQRKFLIAILSVSYRLLLGCMFLTPLATGKWHFNSALTAAVFGLASLVSPFYNLAVYNWIISLTPENIRGRYLALKDALSYVFLTLITIGMGWVLDEYKRRRLPYQGFLACGAVIVILTVINLVCLLLAKEPASPVEREPVRLRDVLMKPLKDSSFRKVIFFYVGWNFGYQFAAPFVNIYLVTGLKLNYTYIMTVGFLANAVRIMATPLWGRLADRKSWELTAELSIAFLAASQSMMFLVNRETFPYLYPALAVLGGIAWGGVGIATFNLQFQYAPLSGRTIYLAANSSLGGLTGFGAVLASSALLGWIGTGIRSSVAFHFGGMQVIFAVSGLLMAGCVLLIHRYLRGVSK